MVDMSNNFGKKEVCKVCQIQDTNNNQQHLLECIVLNCHSTPELVANKFTKYSDIYVEDPNKVVQISKLLYKSFQKREIFLE